MDAVTSIAEGEEMGDAKQARNQNQRSKLGSGDLDQLLYSRKDVARLLGGIHVSTVARLEKQGQLHPIRLNRFSPNGQVYFRADEVLALIESACRADSSSDEGPE